LIVAYPVAAVIAATAPLAACPALDTAVHQVSHHDHGHQHQRESGTKAADCLKCCLGACLVAPGLPGPNVTASQPAFVEVPVRYWGGFSAVVGHPVSPETGPPRPIT
jgi:hypothetical protein